MKLKTKLFTPAIIAALLTAGTAYAQTATTSTTTPPSTGAGGEVVTTVALLLVLAVAALSGIIYLAIKNRKVSE